MTSSILSLSLYILEIIGLFTVFSIQCLETKSFICKTNLTLDYLGQQTGQALWTISYGNFEINQKLEYQNMENN